MAARDAELVRMALSLSEKAKRITPPNPWVGCIVVNAAGEIVGRGYHTGPGKPHAEVEAIRDAEQQGFTDFSQATVYTTLEPCTRNVGKRTPPCDELLISKKVKRCVIGHVDPDKKFGGGIDTLRQAGMQVDVGVAEDDVKRSLRAYMHHRRTNMPFVIAKMACSLDGHIACADGTSQWITKAAAREDAHKLRADSQAIIVGSGTAMIDKPSLTVRLKEDPGLRSQPLRVVLDTHGRVLEGPLMDTKVAPTLMFTGKGCCSEATQQCWKQNGVEWCEVPLAEAAAVASSTGSEQKQKPVLDLQAVLAALGSRGVLQAMVEGGGILQAALLKQKLCNELRVYLGATILGSTAKPWAQGELTATIGDAAFWKLRDMRRLDDDVCLEYEQAPDTAKDAS